MNVEIGAEAAQFPEKEYINGFRCSVSACAIELCWYEHLTDKMMDAGLSHVWMSRQPQPGFHKDQPRSSHQLSWILSLIR
jgi:hypothetical protein